jgi:8-oxo-dGTP pyrophosphatase MutT (NUDIX family)
MLREFPLAGPLQSVLDRGADAPDVPVRHAATVMLVRPGPGDQGVEVFTIARPPTMVFAAGMLVFPGGAVDARDADPTVPWFGPSPAQVATALATTEDLGRAVLVAAVRETFEECGVLLAGVPGGEPVDEPLRGPEWDTRRQGLLTGTLALADLLREVGLELRADLLRPWAQWVTPPGERRRFDTRFLVAVQPAGQQARYLAGEAERAAWMSPSTALQEWAAGTLPMLPPTAVAMEELAVAPSVEKLMSTPRVLRPVSPWLAASGAEDDGSPRYVLQVDLDGVGGGEPGPGQDR